VHWHALFLTTSVQIQQLLLRDADDTLLATMDQLLLANLVVGGTRKSLGLLHRMLQLQMEAFGAGDIRCLTTAKKIELLEASNTPPETPGEVESPRLGQGKAAKSKKRK
jgi:hypothetical protein